MEFYHWSELDQDLDQGANGLQEGLRACSQGSWDCKMAPLPTQWEAHTPTQSSIKITKPSVSATGGHLFAAVPRVMGAIIFSNPLYSCAGGACAVVHHLGRGRAVKLGSVFN